MPRCGWARAFRQLSLHRRLHHRLRHLTRQIGQVEVLLLRCTGTSFSQTLLGLAAGNDEVIIFAVAPPWTRRHIANFDKLPIGHVSWRESEVIAHGRGNIQAGSMVQIWLWPFILEHILEVIRAKGAAIFPLRVAITIPLSNSDPAIFAH